MNVMETLHSLIGSDNVIVKLVITSGDEDTLLFETLKPVMGQKLFELVPEKDRKKTVKCVQFKWINGDPMLLINVGEDEKPVPSTLKSILYLFGDQSTRICIIRSGAGRIYTGSIAGFLSNLSDVYNPSILYAPVENMYNETNVDDNGNKKTTFFIKIGGQYDNRRVR